MPKVVKSLLLWLVLLAVPLQGEAKTYLLSVGISDYPGSRNDLRLPHNDAATMQWVYQQNKYAQTKLLINSQAKLATVKAALRNMVAKATANDIVVLFFSGHGVPGGFVCYDGILSYGSIYSAMATCKSRNKMIFADACFAGAMRQNRNTRHQGGGVRKNSNVMLFLSCRGNEVSIESKKTYQWLLYLCLAARIAGRCRRQPQPHHYSQGTLRLCQRKGEAPVGKPATPRDVGTFSQ